MKTWQVILFVFLICQGLRLLAEIAKSLSQIAGPIY